VLIDPKLTITLSDEQRVSGLIEAVKICYCRGESSFQEYLALEPAINMTVDRTERIVTCSLLAKKWFIEVDEFDKAERLLLNFGHSFGHAIEGASHFRVAHGVGVGVGMLCAIELGTLIGRNYSGIVRVSALKEHLHSLITAVPGLSDELVELSIPDVLDRFQADKKHRSDFYTVILIAQTGDVEIVRLPRNEGSMDTIRIAIERTIETITGLFDCKERP
jgi:3-dehydroquinate synthase